MMAKMKMKAPAAQGLGEWRRNRSAGIDAGGVEADGALPSLLAKFFTNYPPTPLVRAVPARYTVSKKTI